MKKFDFKLEALLKLRSFKEEQARVELGMMRKELERLKDMIDTEKSHIEEAARSQLHALRGNVVARNIQFYPEFFEGKEISIDQIKEKCFAVQRAIDFKIEEWKKLRADVKVIEKLRDKKFQEHKKTENKKEDMKLEELVQLWNQSN